MFARAPTWQVPQWLYAGMRRVEQLAAYGQGKGYGSGTVDHEVAAVSRFLAKSPVLAIDIGAHAGLYTQALRRRHPKLEVHAFEPSPVNVQRLHRRLGGDTGVCICPLALAGTNGQAVLYSEAPGSGLASLHRRRLDHWQLHFECEQPVQTIRFEDYWNDRLGRRHLDIVKMDVEGLELDVLRGFGKAIERVDVLQFEFGGTNIDSRTYFQDFYYFFKESGFTLYRITPIGLERIERYREHDEFFFTINYLAVSERLPS
jgi:FkbM family methyltransferase